METPIAAARLSSDLASILATATAGFACLVIFAGAISALRAGRHTGTLLATYLGIGLEFLLAAGLIRLAAIDTFTMLALTSAIIAVRRTIVFGLRQAARAAG